MTTTGRPTRTKVSPLVTSTIGLLKELIELLEIEPDLVLNRKVEEHKALLKRKQKLVLDYRSSMKALINEPEMLKGLPEEPRKALKALGQKLAEVAERNARALRSAVVATQRLIQNIITIVKDEVLPKGAYKNPQTSYMQFGIYSPTCAPVAVRRSV
jgi:flagellar biosynthesis/type III secretory pathway chaperone